MGSGAAVVKDAGGRYRRVYVWARHPVRSTEAEAHHLHEVERAGESGETPYIAVMGLIVFLASVFLLMLGIALAAYYLA